MKQKLGMKANRAELFSRFGILLIFALVVLVASLVSNRFLSTDNILSVFTQCTVIGVLSCGMTMLIVSGNTDLSAGSGVALAGVVCALVINTSGSWVLAVLATVAVMLLTSALQGTGTATGGQLLAMLTRYFCPSDIETDATVLEQAGCSGKWYSGNWYSAATNVNGARRAKWLPGHQCLDYLVKRPLII